MNARKKVKPKEKRVKPTNPTVFSLYQATRGGGDRQSLAVEKKKVSYNMKQPGKEEINLQ